jgi:hypothetical protein
MSRCAPSRPPLSYLLLTIWILKTPLLSAHLLQIYAQLIMHDRNHQRNNKVRSRRRSNSCARRGVLSSSQCSPHSSFHPTHPMRNNNHRPVKRSKFAAYISARVGSRCVHRACTSYATCKTRVRTSTSQRTASRWQLPPAA